MVVSYNDGTIVKGLPPIVVVAFPSAPASERSVFKTLQGLCSNYDSVASNDMITRGGALTQYPETFASSWEVDYSLGDVQLFPYSIPYSAGSTANPYAFCPIANRTKVRQENCNFDRLRADCSRIMDMAAMYANCFYDYCLNGPTHNGSAIVESMCSYLSMNPQYLND